MKDGAILCEHGPLQRRDRHPGAARRSPSETREAREFVEEFTLADGRRLYLLADGRLVNLSAAEGHPALVMDMSFANQALAAEYAVAARGDARAEGLSVVPDGDRRRDRAAEARDDGRRDRQAHRGAGEVPRLVGRGHLSNSAPIRTWQGSDPSHVRRWPPSSARPAALGLSRPVRGKSRRTCAPPDMTGSDPRRVLKARSSSPRGTQLACARLTGRPRKAAAARRRAADRRLDPRPDRRGRRRRRDPRRHERAASRPTSSAGRTDARSSFTTTARPRTRIASVRSATSPSSPTEREWEGEELLVIAGDNLFDFSLATYVDFLARQRTAARSPSTTSRPASSSSAVQRRRARPGRPGRRLRGEARTAGSRTSSRSRPTSTTARTSRCSRVPRGGQPARPAGLLHRVALHARAGRTATASAVSGWTSATAAQLLEADNRYRRRAGLPERDQYLLD